MAFQGVVRFVCWPWFDCRCPAGKLVSESVMRRHLKVANERRKELGRGAFKAGPKVTDPFITDHRFTFIESLEDHDTDDEGAGMTDALIENPMETPHQSNINFIANEARVHNYHNFEGNGEQLIEPSHEATYSSSNDDELGIDEADLYHSDSAFLSSNDQINHPVDHGYRADKDHPLSGTTSDNSELAESERMVLSLLDNDNINQQNLADTSSFVEEGRDVASDGSILLDGECHSEGELIPCADEFEFSRIPKMLPWVLENKTWVDFYIKHGLEFTVMEDILERVGAPCKKWITVMNCIARSTSIMESLVTVPNCPGHMCYANIRASIVRDERSYELLYGYRHNYLTETGVRRDYFNSVAFQRLCRENGGEESLRYDIFLSASTDGFQAHKNKAYDVWPVADILFNLPPEQRTCVKNVIPLMFIPEGKEPKDLQSYLIPFVNELLEVAASGGALLRFFDGIERCVRVHLIHFTSDSPAIAKVASLKGHHGKCHCRFCRARGVYSPLARGYYFPSKYRSESGEMVIMYSPQELPMRTEASTSEAFLLLENAVTSTERDFVSRETGINGRSVLCELPTMVTYTCFPIDTMHLFYNLQVRLLELLTNADREEYTLGATAIDRLDDEMRSWSMHISGQLCPRPKPLSQFRRWKAAEHRMFTLQHCLILFNGYLPQEYLDGLQHFVELVDICTQTTVTESQIERCGTYALSFFRHYEEKYMRYDCERINLSKSVFHQVLHLKECLNEFGPLPYCAQNWMEGYIGWISDRNNARHLAAESMARNAFFLDCCKAFFEEPFQYSAEHYDRLQDGNDIEFLSSFGRFSICQQEDGGRKIRNLLAHYLKRKYCLDPSESRLMAQRMDTFESFSRLRFYCGNGTQTAKIYKNNVFVDGSRRVKRESSYIAVEMDCNDDSADVYYGRLMSLLEFKLQKLDEEEDGLPWHTKHQVAVVDWVSGIRIGAQGQIYRDGRASQCFTSSTMEDAIIISRLIGVVEHTIPRQSGGMHSRCSQSSQADGRTRTYFVDERVRSDFLLNEQRSPDGVRRVLRGLRSSR